MMPPAPALTAAISHGIRKDQLKQEPSQAAGSKKKSHKTVTMARLGLSAREGTLPVHQPVHLVVAGQQRRQFWRKGTFALTFSLSWQPQHSLLHALHVPCPAGELGLRRRRPAGVEHSSMPCSGTTQHVLAVCRAATGSAPRAHQDSKGWGGLAASPRAQPNPKRN